MNPVEILMSVSASGWHGGAMTAAGATDRGPDGPFRGVRGTGGGA